MKHELAINTRKRMTDFADGLILEHWADIEDLLSDEDAQSEVSISIGHKITIVKGLPYVKTKIGFAKKFTDDNEGFVDDPDQIEMEMEGEE